MAGGRRPASYVSGARHNTGVERTATTTTAQNHADYGLPPWIPSIWQPPAGKTATYEREQEREHERERERRTAVRGDTTHILAAALDTAVQSAVMRALDTAGCATTGSQTPKHFAASAASSDGGFDDDIGSCAVVSARERELLETVKGLEVQLRSRDDDVRQLTKRLEAVEGQLTRKVDVTFEADCEGMVAELAAQMNARMKDMLASQKETQDELNKSLMGFSRLLDIREKGLEKTEVALKGLEKNFLYYKGRHGIEREQVGEQICELKRVVETQYEMCHAKVDDVASSSKQLVRHVVSEGVASESNLRREEVLNLKKEMEDELETVTSSMRLKMRRLESHIDDVIKQVNETAALRSGFEEGMQSTMEGFDESIKSIRLQMADVWKQTDEKGLHKRIDTIDSNVKCLKKLIESNLRTQWDAENIVKDQVSLITKHVCVAMRQYTARRISENNSLIDQALRARVPEYANNDDEQFVLVREEFADGNETIDIHNMSSVTSTASWNSK